RESQSRPRKILDWDVGWAQANRLIVFVDSTARVIRSPAGGILKETDGANSAITTKIKPMTSFAWNTDQISSFHFNYRERAVLGMDVKQAAAVHNETNLIFLVPVFAVEFRQHGLESRSAGINVDEVGGLVSSTSFQAVDLLSKSGEQHFRRCSGLDRLWQVPMFVVDADARKLRSHRIMIPPGGVLIRNFYDCHAALFKTNLVRGDSNRGP